MLCSDVIWVCLHFQSNTCIRLYVKVWVKFNQFSMYKAYSSFLLEINYTVQKTVSICLIYPSLIFLHSLYRNNHFTYWFLISYWLCKFAIVSFLHHVINNLIIFIWQFDFNSIYVKCDNFIFIFSLFNAISL